MVSFVVVLTTTTSLLHVWETWMILTNKRLLVEIFLTRRLPKSLAFCQFASFNFEPWMRHDYTRWNIVHLRQWKAEHEHINM